MGTDFMSQTAFPNKKQFASLGAIKVVLLIATELGLIHISRHLYGFECYREQFGFCDVARNALLASYGLGAAFILLGFFDPGAFHRLLSTSDTRAAPLGVNLLGLCALIASLPLLRADLAGWHIAAMAVLWTAAITAVVSGLLLMIAPLPQWRAFLQRLGWAGPLVIAAAAAAPFLAIEIRPFWDIDVLVALTFDSVIWLLEAWDTQVTTTEGTRILGAGTFFVDVAPSCSGIEGLVLTTTFASIYMGLFRKDLRFPHAFLILPVALLASWGLNALRIAILVQLGISGWPELAVGGFHSHAGWLMFTLLSLAIVLVAQAVPFFHRADVLSETQDAAGAKDVPPFLQDPVVAQILPFVVFMASALLASTFAQDPALAYPARAVAMLTVLVIFLPYLRNLPWRMDPLALGAGVLIAAYWSATAPPPPETSTIAELTGAAAAVWVIARVVGTALCVPIIEELFFRSYLMDRLAPVVSRAHWTRSTVALLVTSALFAVLHDRWIEAGIAGLIFGALVLRSRNVTDAILAHAVANGLIAAYALSTGNWSAI